MSAKPRQNEPTYYPATDIYDDGYLRVEHDNYYVACQGHPIYTLSRKEFLIISRLARDFGRPVNHLNLWSDVWGDQTEYKRDALKVHIANTRRKLAPYGLGIMTMVNIGYRLIQIPTHNPDVSSHIKGPCDDSPEIRPAS
jgi:DNA-binding response OmpR family regulator